MSSRTPPLLRLLALLAPGSRRAAWIREWSGELAHARHVGAGLSTVYLAALEDATGLRARTLRHGSVLMDVRYALRSLLRRPGFTAVVVLTLGLGLGASVALFSAVRGIALRPLPYDDPDGVVMVTTAFRGHFEATAFPASEPEYLELEEENPAFEELAAYYLGESNLAGTGEPRRATVVQATANVLDVLGVEVALGRGFAEDEDRPSAERAAILTHGLWLEGWGADPGAVGETVRIDGRAHTVVGVLPPDFEFPGGEPDVLATLRIDRADPGGRSSHWLEMLARLRDGVDIEAARAETRALLARWEEEFPDRHGLSPEGHPALITGVREAMTGEMEQPLTVLAGAVFLVLLVACLNVANLLLVRGEDRRREFGVRTALGAGRGALVRQLLVESGFLAVAGGAVGLGLAVAALRVLPTLARGTLPPNTVLTVDGAVLAAAAVLVLAVAVVFGLLPSWAVDSDVAGTLREGGRKSTAGRSRLTFRRALVVVEVAAAVALIAGAGVLARSFGQLLSVDPGLRVEGVALVDLELNPASYPTTRDVASFHAELKRRAEDRPEIVSVGAIRTAPLGTGGGWESVAVPGETPLQEGDGRNWTVQYQVVDPGIFEALGIPVVSGRAPDAGDAEGSMPVVVVNRSAARALWGEKDPVGRELQLGGFPGNTNPLMSVVGVVEDVHQTSLDREPPPQIYVPRAQAGANYGGLGTRFATVVVRTRADAAEALTVVRSLIRDMDPALPVASARTMGEQVGRSVGDRRFLVVLMGLFSGAAALLGAVGLYGLMAYVVRRRRHEFGIRYALGAARGRVVGGVVGEAALLLVMGSLVGVALAWLGGDLLDGLIYGVTPRDPAALLAAPLLLTAVGLLAAWLPARRASAVDPARVLREE